MLARVGSDVILAGDVMPAYEEIMARIPENELAAIPKDRLELEKKALIAKLLEEQIKTKLMYQDAKRTIPQERLPEIRKQIAEHFEQKELPARIEKAGVASRRELDEKLRAIGSSLERAKRAFVQQMLAVQWMQQQNDLQPEVSHEDMVEYYFEHLADFETPARARWEHLMVYNPRYSDGSEARAKLARMGNQLLQGMSAADVLKAQPKGDLVCGGGVQGWITQGSLEVSPKIEQAIFGLPVGRPSRIFRDGDAWHIVRVLEREESKRTRFDDPEAQRKIREEIRKLRRQEQIEDYLARLRQEIPVWTVFDDDPELAQLRSPSDASRN